MINEELINKTMTLINQYEAKYRELAIIEKQLSNLALKEIENLSYIEAKEYYNNMVKDYTVYEVRQTIEDLLKKKKEQEYPEILDVHYYPCIKDMGFLTKEQQILLDKFLMENYDYRKRINKYKLLDVLNLNLKSYQVDYNNPIVDKVIDFLLNKRIFEKQYVFYCHCYHNHRTIFTEEQKQQFYKYHNFDNNNCTNEELKEHEMSYYNTLWVDCDNDLGYKISSIKDFEENLDSYSYIYKIIAEPDMTLDKL